LHRCRASPSCSPGSQASRRATSELYERIGYLTLTRLGLIPYPAFRDALAKLSASGLAQHDTAPDGSTVWWVAEDPPN
jgi:hypothetical protein